MPGDPFIIVQKVATAVKNKFFFINFDSLHMVRGMTVNDVSARLVY